MWVLVREREHSSVVADDLLALLAKEREACAKVCGSVDPTARTGMEVLLACQRAIRGRGPQA